MEAYGRGGQRAIVLGRLKNLARLYWYTVEFGLVRQGAGLRIFGAGIMSSAAETVFALDDPSPHRVEFDLERVMRTKYIIDDFQKVYFVIDSFQQLLDECDEDFGELYQRLRHALTIEPHELIHYDQVIHYGTQQYFHDKAVEGERNKKPTMVFAPQ
jgi:phenylalanine-4-hydroxylase